MPTNKLIIDALQYPLRDRDYFIRAQNAGLDLIHITVVFWENIHETMNFIGDWIRFIEQNDDLLQLATNEQGLQQDTLGNGKISLLFGFQNCSSIENNIDMLTLYRRLNVGVMQLSYNNHSHLCCGCYEQQDLGLTRFGKAVIQEMNRIGMLIDMSHSSQQSTIEAIEYSKRPIAITHAQSLTFKKALRNKSDDLIKRLVDNGGMFGLSLYPFHLHNGSECRLEEFLDEIKRLVDLVGIDHIGFGTDNCEGQPLAALEYMRNGHWTKQLDYGEGSAANNNWPKPPTWFQSVDDFAHFRNSLLSHGFHSEEADKLLGINWHNFLSATLSPKESFTN